MVEQARKFTSPEELIESEISKITVGRSGKPVPYIEHYGGNAPLFKKMMETAVALKMATITERRPLQVQLDMLSNEAVSLGMPKTVCGNVVVRAERIANLVKSTFNK